MTQNDDPVMAPEALASLLGHVVVLDARPEAAVASGRCRGAVHLPIEAWDRAAKTASIGLGDAAHWASAIGALGIDGSRAVAVLDDGRMTEAARGWFLLQHFGVPAAVVDGGWPAAEPVLRAAGLIDTGPLASPAAAAFVPRPGAGRVALTERAPLRDALADGSGPQVFDTRSRAEYVGEDLKKNRRGGRLPGAANLPHADLLGEGSRLLPAAALRDLLDRAGLRPGGQVVTHCDGGGRAALAALAAVRAGYADVAVYYLSFADWAADESCPIHR